MTDLALSLQRVQVIRKAVLLVLILALTGLAILSRPASVSLVWEAALKTGGLALIALAIAGRAWCSLYIGGRKKAEVVDLGPYSITRNPLYIFNVIGAVGIGSQSGSLLIAGLFGSFALAVFHFTMRREEAWLSAAFGVHYDAYRARTPRFWPDFARWRDAERLEVRPRYFLLTVRDGLAFLLAVPVFAGVEHARHEGWTTPFLTLF